MSSRRMFLRHGLLGWGLLAWHGGCRPHHPAPDAEAEASGDPCMDLSGLTEAEKAARAALAYVAESPYPAMRCDTCQFWLPPAAGAACGGCVILKGPVHPEGYCTSWAPPPPS